MTEQHETTSETLTFSLSSAAKELGKSKATISRAIHNGKLSAEKNESGGYIIQASELFRVYPRNETERTKKNDAQPPKGNPETASETNALQHQVKLLEELRKHDKERIEELKQERDEWREQSKLLAIRSQPTEKQPQKPRKRFKLFGG